MTNRAPTHMPLLILLRGLITTIAISATLFTMSPVATAAPEDVDHWTRSLRRAPVARASNWTPPGIQPIVAFSGVLWLPPKDNGFIGDVAITGAGAWQTRLVWNDITQDFDERSLASYTIFLGRGPEGFPQAQLQGSQGSALFVSASQPGRCELDEIASYCAEPELDEGGFMASERFYGITVGEQPAVVNHWGQMPNGPPGWGITWYDPADDHTYSFSAFSCSGQQSCAEDVAVKFGPQECPLRTGRAPSCWRLSRAALSMSDSNPDRCCAPLLS